MSATKDHDLVGRLEHFKTKVTRHDERSFFQFGGTAFIPEKDSLVASYSSNPDVPFEHTGKSTDGDGSATLMIVIACIAGGVILAAIVAAGIVSVSIHYTVIYFIIHLSQTIFYINIDVQKSIPTPWIPKKLSTVE